MSFQEQLLLIFLAILPVLKLACINFFLFISSSSTALEWLTVNTTASAPSVRIGLTPWTEAPMPGTAWWLKNSSCRPKSRYAFFWKHSLIVKFHLYVWIKFLSHNKNYISACLILHLQIFPYCQLKIPLFSAGESLKSHREKLRKKWISFSF